MLTDFPVDYDERAGKHQRAVTQLLREQENGTADFDSAPPMMELDPKAWDAIRAHNNAIAEAECTFVPLEDVCLGPGHVAKKLIGGAVVRFNDEEIDCMALIIWELEKAFHAKLHAKADAPVLPGAHVLAGGCADTPAVLPMRQRYLLRNDLGLPRVLIVGG